MGGSSDKAPAQPTTKTDLGAFGTTTTGSFGNTWNPTSFQQGFINNAQTLMSNAQNALLNQEISEERIKNLYNKFNDEFSANYLAPAMQKGLLRGSTASDVYAMGQKNFQDQYQDLLDAEEQRNYQRLASALGNYTTLYDMAKGTTGLSQSANKAASDYLLKQYELDQANKSSNNALYNMIGQGVGAAGTIGGALLPSDKRLKENINKLDTVDGVNIYEYNYKEGLGLPEGRQVGVIAQEVVDLPDVVGKTDTGILYVNYTKLPAKVQERIEELR